MKGKLLAFGLCLMGMAVVGVNQSTVKAVDTTRDCDQYAVVKCGMMTASELRAEYSTNNGSSANGTTARQPDIQRVFSALGISGNALNGEFKNGTVYRDGTVKVGGRTVATGAVMAARNLGGSPIAGTNASRISVSAMGDAQTALVKLDANGRFLFAVMKPCGNPVSAHATQPPVQPPTTPPSAMCKNLAVTPITGSSHTKFRFTAQATVAGGAKIKSYRFEVMKGGKLTSTLHSDTSATQTSVTYTQARPGDYKVRVTAVTSLGEKSGQNCVGQFSVPKPPEGNVRVCDQTTGQIITVKESEASKYKPVDSPECAAKPCDTTMDQNQCQPSETPEELPTTGAADVFMKLLGASSLTGASAYYVASRRHSN